MAESKTKKSLVGRPSKYDPSMLVVISKLLGQGASLTELAVKLGVNRDTIQDWRDPKSPRYSEEFSVALKDGLEASHAWWLEQGRVALREKDFQYVGWYMNMKNRFGWRDKHEEIDRPPLSPVVFINEVPAPKLNHGDHLPDDKANSKPPAD